MDWMIYTASASVAGASTIPWYLARWRMQAARTLLTEDAATVAEVAGRLDYRSETAFSRAYKRVIGVPPSTPCVPESIFRPVVGIRVSGYPHIGERGRISPTGGGERDPLPTVVPDRCNQRRRDDDDGLYVGSPGRPTLPELDRHPVPLRCRHQLVVDDPDHVALCVHHISRDADIMNIRNAAVVPSWSSMRLPQGVGGQPRELPPHADRPTGARLG